MDEDGRSRGFGHVEFETAEGAQKALSKSGHNVEGRDIFCDLARERGAAPQSGGATYVYCHFIVVQFCNSKNFVIVSGYNLIIVLCARLPLSVSMNDINCLHSFSPNGGTRTRSGDGTTAFVRGFDKFQDEDTV